MSNPPSTWPIRKVELDPPPLQSLVPVIKAGLESNFHISSVSVSLSPDFRQAPYHLASEGLSGHPRIADVGGPPYLTPSPDLTKKYDLLSISKDIEMAPNHGLLLGAGAGPFYVLGTNSELMPNLSYRDEEVVNRTHYAMIQGQNEVSCRPIESSTGFAFMANIFASDGLRGDLLHITAKSRMGSLNFTETLQRALKQGFGSKLISVGGVFVIKKGRANLHVMPDFPAAPFSDRKDVENWLRYFDMDAPLTCLSVFHSGDDHGLGLRMEHTHCFSVDDGKRGGHYHYDLDDTKEDIEYEAWFNVAEVLYRIDQPGL